MVRQFSSILLFYSKALVYGTSRGRDVEEGWWRGQSFPPWWDEWSSREKAGLHHTLAWVEAIFPDSRAEFWHVLLKGLIQKQDNCNAHSQIQSLSTSLYLRETNGEASTGQKTTTTTKTTGPLQCIQCVSRVLNALEINKRYSVAAPSIQNNVRQVPHNNLPR